MMWKKPFVFVLIAAFLMSQPGPLLAQIPDMSQVAEKLEEAQAVAKEGSSQTEDDEYKQFTCPSCGRDFEIKIDPNNIELKKGIKKVICPYDGTEFYPKAYVVRQEELEYETVRCPSCGKEFNAYVDVKAMLAGQSQVLVCPYDKKKFYFKAERFRPTALKWANLQTVMCPTDKRVFKAYVDPENIAKITCPYDGTEFFPTPDLILSGRSAKDRMEEAQYELGGSATTEELMNVANQKLEGSQPGAEPAMADISRMGPSRIEEMFSEHIPLNVSKSIQQFGYDIFISVKKTKKSGQEEDRSSDQGSASAKATPETKLLKALLSSKEQDSSYMTGADTEGGLSVFDTPTEIPAIEEYILGPGDTLIITIWGQVQQTSQIKIDADGKVLLPKVGPVYLWGLKFTDAEKLIKEHLLKAYTNIQVGVSLGRLRGIKVFVLGEARKPGAYTISALSNSFHALYAAGGPTKLGSLRRMKLVRKGSADMPIDLYSMLLKGDNSQDYKLQSNDTIFVPPIGDVVGVAGNVKRPAIYELKEKIKLSDAIDMAGGLSSVGYLQRIQVERISDHIKKTVLDLEFKSMSNLINSPNNLELQDGDLVIVFPITALRYNFVSIAGNVLRPGDYELKEGMKLKDLTDKAGGVLPGTYLQRAEIARFRGDQTREIIAVSLADLLDGNENANIPLKEWDVITVYAKKDVVPDIFVEIDGAVNKPGRYELTESMKISDLIFRAGGLKTNALMANAELFRSYLSSEPKIFSVDLNNILSKDSEIASKSDLALEEGDHLFIRNDIAKDEKLIITLTGEFKYPGKYAVEKGTRMSSVIKRAGGFSDDAFLDGASYTRESARIAQQKMIKKFLNFEQNAMLQEQSSLAIGMTAAQADARNKLVEYRQKMMRELESMRAPGRILIRLNPNMDKFANSEYDLIIEDGDTLNIPTYSSTVQVVGNVYGPGIVAFSEGKGIDYYINKTGGLTQHADSNRIFVIKANGETVSNFARAMKVKRGDTIIVPEEFKYKTLPGLFFKDMVQIMYQTALGAIVTITAINTL